jgi:hypothetical protein
MNWNSVQEELIAGHGIIPHFKIGISWYTATVDLHMDNLKAFLESQFNDLSAAESLQ